MKDVRLQIEYIASEDLEREYTESEIHVSKFQIQNGPKIPLPYPTNGKPVPWGGFLALLKRLTFLFR